MNSVKLNVVWKAWRVSAQVGPFLLNDASNTILVRRDGAEAAAGRGLHLARRVVGVSRVPVCLG
jgi:hypothetical protein